MEGLEVALRSKEYTYSSLPMYQGTEEERRGWPGRHCFLERARLSLLIYLIDESEDGMNVN